MKFIALALALLWAPLTYAQSMGAPGLQVPGAFSMGPWFGPFMPPGTSTFTPTAFAGVPSAFFGDTNNLFQATTAQSNYLTSPTTAFYLPTVAASSYATCTTAGRICSWTLLWKFTYTGNAWPAPNNAATQVLGFGGNCTGGCGANPGDRGFWMSTPGASATAGRNSEINLYASVTTATTPQLWVTPAACGPSGAYACATTQTGIDLIPGRNYCAVLSQYGVDTSSDGLMSLSIVDSTGAEAPGSPVVTTAVNDTSGTQGFYYSAAAIRTQLALGNLMPNMGILSTATTHPQGAPGPMADVAMIWGQFPNSAATPTQSLVQHLCDGSDSFPQWWTEYTTAATAGSFGTELLHAWYPLNPSAGVTLAGTSPTPTITTALTAAGGTAVAASPITVSPALTLTDYGAADVMRVEPGSGAVGATGTIYFAINFNASKLGGTPTGFQGKVLGGPAGAGAVYQDWTSLSGLTLGAAGATGYLSGLPASYLATIGGNTANATPYTICTRATNAPTYSYCSQEPIYLGLVVWVEGQSQLNLLFGTTFTPGAANAADSANTVKVPVGDIIVGNVAGVNLVDPTASTNYTSNCRTGYAGCPGGPLSPNRQYITSASGPENVLGTGVFGGTCAGPCPYTAVGDGALQAAVTLATLSNLPVKIIDISHSGTSVDNLIAGGITVAGKALDHGTVNTLKLLSTAITMTDLTNPATGTHGASAGLPWVSGFYYSILPGSVKVYDANNCLLANDAGNTGGATGSGAFLLTDGGCGAGAVAGGVINYAPNTNPSSSQAPYFSTNLTFASDPTCPCTVTYTTLVDVQSGTNSRQSIGSGLFTGLDLWGQGIAPGTGQITSVLNNQSGPPNIIEAEQAAANLSSGLGINPPPANNSANYFKLFQSEWDYVWSTKMAAYWWWQSNTGKGSSVFAEGGYPRDTSNSYINVAGGSQYFQNAGASGGSHMFGGTFDDNTVQVATLGQAGSPHEDASPFGSIRQGRRFGVYWWNEFLGTSPATLEPTISTVAFTTDTTYNAGCSVSGTCIRITFAIGSGSSATKLETCGANLSGGTAPAGTSPACVFTDYTSTPTIKGLSFGTSVSGTFIDVQGNDESSIATVLNGSGDLGAVCKLQAALVVECLMNNPAYWAGQIGSVYLKYNDPFNTNGSVQSINVVPGVYVAGTATTVTGSGGTCSTHSTATLSVVSTALVATRRTIGACTVAETSYPVPGGFTGVGGGSATPAFGSAITDINDMGTKLYDNSGGFGLTGAAGGSEPGYPVTTVNVPQGPF